MQRMAVLPAGETASIPRTIRVVATGLSPLPLGKLKVTTRYTPSEVEAAIDHIRKLKRLNRLIRHDPGSRQFQETRWAGVSLKNLLIIDGSLDLGRMRDAILQKTQFLHERGLLLMDQYTHSPSTGGSEHDSSFLENILVEISSQGAYTLQIKDPALLTLVIPPDTRKTYIESFFVSFKELLLRGGFRPDAVSRMVSRMTPESLERTLILALGRMHLTKRRLRSMVIEEIFPVVEGEGSLVSEEDKGILRHWIDQTLEPILRQMTISSDEMARAAESFELIAEKRCLIPLGRGRFIKVLEPFTESIRGFLNTMYLSSIVVVNFEREHSQQFQLHGMDSKESQSRIFSGLQVLLESHLAPLAPSVALLAEEKTWLQEHLQTVLNSRYRRYSSPGSVSSSSSSDPPSPPRTPPQRGSNP